MLDRLAPRTNRDEPEKYRQLNQLVEDGELDLSNKRVLQTYMDKMRRRTVISDETAESDSKFISKMLREGKINLSDPEMAKEFLDTRGYHYYNKYFGIREALVLTHYILDFRVPLTVL